MKAAIAAGVEVGDAHLGGVRPGPAGPRLPSGTTVQLVDRLRAGLLLGEGATRAEALQGGQGQGFAHGRQTVTEGPAAPGEEGAQSVVEAEDAAVHLEAIVAVALPEDRRLESRQSQLFGRPRVQGGEGQGVGGLPERRDVLQRRLGEERAHAEAQGGPRRQLGPELGESLHEATPASSVGRRLALNDAVGVDQPELRGFPVETEVQLPPDRGRALRGSARPLRESAEAAAQPGLLSLRPEPAPRDDPLHVEVPRGRAGGGRRANSHGEYDRHCNGGMRGRTKHWRPPAPSRREGAAASPQCPA